MAGGQGGAGSCSPYVNVHYNDVSTLNSVGTMNAGGTTCVTGSSEYPGGAGAGSLITCEASSSRRNSFDLVLDAVKTWTRQAEVQTGHSDTAADATLATEPQRPAKAAPATFSRPFEHESSAGFEGYETIELKPLPLVSSRSTLHPSIAAIRPLPTAHIVGSQKSPASGKTTSSSSQQKAGATKKGNAPPQGLKRTMSFFKSKK